MAIRKRVLLLFIILFIFFLGFIIPEEFAMPVEKAGKSNYAQNSFWAYPWGKSVTHKGVDIFGREGTRIYSSTRGMVLKTGQNQLGGNYVLVLGPKWRLHYYAHLKDIKTSPFTFVSNNDVIGLVGTTGNAKGKPPHLHYSIKTIIPYPWKKDNAIQGWRKMFYVDPIPFLNQASL